MASKRRLGDAATLMANATRLPLEPAQLADREVALASISSEICCDATLPIEHQRSRITLAALKPTSRR